MSALLAVKEGKDYSVKGVKWILKTARDLKTKPPVGETGIELQPIGGKAPPVDPGKGGAAAGEAISKVSFGAKALAVAGFLFTVAAVSFCP